MIPMLKKILIISLVAASAVIVFTVLFQDNEKGRIKKLFSVISDSIEKKTDENPIIGAAKAKQIKETLSDSCVIEIPSRTRVEVMSEQEITSYIFSRRMNFLTVSFNFHDITVEMLDKITSRTALLAVLKGELKTQEPIEETHEIEFILKKAVDDWRITRIKFICINCDHI